MRVGIDDSGKYCLWNDENEKILWVEEIHKAPGLRCERCRKYSEDVDTDPMFPLTCLRCASALHAMHYDLAHGATFLVPSGVAHMTPEEFTQNFCRPEFKGKTFQECWDMCKDRGGIDPQVCKGGTEHE